MPVYEYECPRCGEVTEAIRTMRNADEPVACEKCGHAQTSRKHSVFMTAAPRSGGGAGDFGPAMGGGGCGAGCGCHPH